MILGEAKFEFMCAHICVFSIYFVYMRDKKRNKKFERVNCLKYSTQVEAENKNCKSS